MSVLIENVMRARAAQCTYTAQRCVDEQQDGFNPVSTARVLDAKTNRSAIASEISYFC